MALPVVTVASGGLPVIDVTASGLGLPVSEMASGFGLAVTKVASGGRPVVYAPANSDGSPPGVVTYTTFNPVDKAATVALSNGNLSATSNTASTVGAVRAIKPVTSGKVYFEAKWTGNTNVDSYTGFQLGTRALNSAYGVGAAAITIFGGQIYVNSSSNIGGLSAVLASGGSVCVAFDYTNQRIWFRFNNGNWNNSGTANPATNVGGFDTSALFGGGVAAYPYVAVQQNDPLATADFGSTAFAFTPPSGFTGVS